MHSNCSRLICWYDACFFAFLSFLFIALSLLISLPFYSKILALSFIYSLSTTMATSSDKENPPPANSTQSLSNTPQTPAVPVKVTKCPCGQPKKETGGPSNSTKNAWRTASDATLINCLIEQCTLGHQSDSGFKDIMFTACAEALADSHLMSGGTPKTATTCSDHWSKV